MESIESFENRVSQALEAMGPEVLRYPESLFAAHRQIYELIWQRSRERRLYNTALALPLVRGILLGSREKGIGFVKAADSVLAYYHHSLSVCQMLINLRVPITAQEEDIAMAAALCHVVREIVDMEPREAEKRAAAMLDPQVYDVVSRITREDPLTEAQQRLFYARIQESKLAILVRLADRGNLLSGLHGQSIWAAQEYIRETIAYFFPMCIYANEHYPELRYVVSILMDKMRYTIEAADILTNRFQVRETEINKEILTLKEENARLRTMIRQIKDENT